MIFSKIKVGNSFLKNRIVISPMCQYSAKNGIPAKWHYKHLLNLSSLGASMLIMESTAIEKRGKITNSDLCLSNNFQEKKFKDLIKFLKRNNDTKIGLQISHSGRKGSSYEPWVKINKPLPKSRAWNTISASPIKRAKGWPTPKEMTIVDIKNLVNKFLMAAKRAKRVGFDCLEIHMAHGYLLHQFFSPISNTRDDIYGGSLENRSRLLVEISKEIRKIWPKNRILGARITGTDHLKKEGIAIADAIYLAKKLKKIGIDYISISSGGILPKTNMKEGQAFRAKIAEKIKLSSNILVTTSGNITNHKTAENLVRKKKIDFITIARILIKEPSWIYKLSKKQKKDDIIPVQYLRIFK